MSRDMYPPYRIATPYIPMAGSPMGASPYAPYQFMYTQPLPTTASMTAEPTAHHMVAQQDRSPVKLEQPLPHHVAVKPEPPPYPAYMSPTGSTENGFHGPPFSPGTTLNVPLASLGQPRRPVQASYPALSLPLPVSSPGQALPNVTLQSSTQTISQVPGASVANGVLSNLPVPVGTQHRQQQALPLVASTVSEFVDTLPPPSPTQSEAFRGHSYPTVPSQQSNCTYGPLTMAPPKHIPQMNRSDSQPNLTTPKQEPLLQLQPDISSSRPPGMELPSASQDYPRQPVTGGMVHYSREYSLVSGPTSQAHLKSPTYPILAQSSSMSTQPPPPISDANFSSPYQPTLILRSHGSRSSSPTNSIISVGSTPSMQTYSAIHTDQAHSISGDHHGSVDLSHGSYKEPELPPYSSSHMYRSRSPNGSCASSYSSLSGSRPGSTRSSHYSDHSRSSHGRSIGSAFSGPLTASLNSAHITPPNPHHTYITLDDLLQAEPTLALSPLNAPSNGSPPGDELINAANQALKQIVNWAKQIRAFMSLPQTTQMTLMKHCWGELLCFVLAVRSAREREREKTMRLPMEPDQSSYPGASYVFQRMSLDLTKWVVEKQLDEIELACLKVIILLDPGEQTICPPAQRHDPPVELAVFNGTECSVCCTVQRSLLCMLVAVSSPLVYEVRLSFHLLYGRCTRPLRVQPLFGRDHSGPDAAHPAAALQEQSALRRCPLRPNYAPAGCHQKDRNGSHRRARDDASFGSRNP